MDDLRGLRRTPFAVATAVTLVAAIAVLILSEELVADLRAGHPFNATQSAWIFRLLLGVALAQAAYVGFAVLRPEKVEAARGRDEKLGSAAPDELVRSIARNAALVPLLTLVYGVSSIALTSDRGSFWAFLPIALTQLGWYYGATGEIATSVGLPALDAASRRPDRPAISAPESEVTGADLERRQRALAGALRAGGLGWGDRIALVAESRPETIEVAMASLRVGIVPVPINPLLTEREARYILEDSGARWLFGAPDASGAPNLERTVAFGAPYEELLRAAPEEELHPTLLGRPMNYTSGTTGVPKGVYVEPSAKGADAASERFRSLWGIHGGDVHLVCSPLAHSAPLRFVLRTLEAGGRVILQGRFDPAAAMRTIKAERVTSTFMVPTHLERLLDVPNEDADLSSIRLLAHAGAPVRESTKRAVIELFPDGSVWEFYGSTEGQATRISTPEWLERPGSVGRALPGAEILVTDESFERMPVGKVGEVWVRDPDAERFSYWGDEPKTKSAWRGDAFTVGDAGYLDADGYLHLTGRKHDTIITGGVNVYPQEVEAVLVEHPEVGEVVVFGIPDPEWGQRVCARVVPTRGASIDTERLRAWARERLAAFKTPREIEVVDRLPRTPTGKVERRGR